MTNHKIHYFNTEFSGQDIDKHYIHNLLLLGKFNPEVQKKLMLTHIQKIFILNFAVHFITPEMRQKEAQVVLGILLAV